QRIAWFAGPRPLRCLRLQITRRGGEILKALLAIERPGLSRLRPSRGMAQRFPRLESRPRRLGDDTDAVRHPDHLDHACHCCGPRFIELVWRRTLDGRA